MENVFDVLKERGLIAQTTHEDEIRELLGKEKVTFYIGFDPTADSLHVGHFLQMVVMKHMQDRACRRRHGPYRRPVRKNGYAVDDDDGNDKP